MKKQAMSDRKPIRQSIVWPQFWNKHINEEIQMHAEKINNLLVIYEMNLLDDIHQEGKIGKNFI